MVLLDVSKEAHEPKHHHHTTKKDERKWMQSSTVTHLATMHIPHDTHNDNQLTWMGIN